MLFKRNAQYLVATAAVASSMCMTSIPARANDVVTEWNQIALAATVTAGEGPNPQTRSMAIVHVSMHDSVNAITGEYRHVSADRAAAADRVAGGGGNRVGPLRLTICFLLKPRP